MSQGKKRLGGGLLAVLLLGPTPAIAALGEASQTNARFGWDTKSLDYAEESTGDSTVNASGVLFGPVAGLRHLAGNGLFFDLSGGYLVGSQDHDSDGFASGTTSVSLLEGSLRGGLRVEPWGADYHRDYALGTGYRRLVDNYGSEDLGFDKEVDYWYALASFDTRFHLDDPLRWGLGLEAYYLITGTTKNHFSDIDGRDLPDLHFNHQDGYGLRASFPVEWASNDWGGFEVAPYLRYWVIQESDENEQAAANYDIRAVEPGNRTQVFGIRFTWHPSHGPRF